MNKNLMIKCLEQFTECKWTIEHRFHPVRRWRFDFACIEKKLAIEINGGVFINGRHNRGSGYVKDLEKINAAIENGWRVLQYISESKMYDYMNQIKNCIK